MRCQSLRRQFLRDNGSPSHLVVDLIKVRFINDRSLHHHVVVIFDRKIGRIPLQGVFKFLNVEAFWVNLLFELEFG